MNWIGGVIITTCDHVKPNNNHNNNNNRWGLGLRLVSTPECSMFVLVFFCCHHLFQRKKRSVSVKKKRSRKSLSKSKAKPLSLLASKKSPAKKFAAKKKRQIPGYQATAPARPRGNFRVKVQRKKKRKKKTKTHQDLPVMRGGKSVMEDPGAL